MSDQSGKPPPSASSLDEVLITDQLAQRPSRPPDFEGEAKAQAALAQAMASAPNTVLQELVNLVLTLCRADSAGISLLEQGEGSGAFRWPAVAGMWAHHAGGSLPRDASPCGVVIDRDAPLLFDHPGRYFPDAASIAPELLEILLVPFYVDGKPIGTVWANAHTPGRKFDGEDARLLTSLSRFAAAAHQMTAALREAAAARALIERDSRAFAQGIVDTMRDPLLVLDSGLRVISASREFYRSFGVSPEETEGVLVYELGDRQWDIPRLRTFLEEILPRETKFRDFEVEHTFEHIGRKVMLLNARRVYREGDGSGQILLVIEDVTERRDAEEARREAEARFTEMVKNVRDHSIFLTDPEGVITSWNVAAERIVGYTEAEAVGRHFSLIFTPEDIGDGIPEGELRQAREEGRAEDERWHVRKGGEPFWALGIVTPLYEPGGRLSGYSKILRDLTDRKRADEVLRESEEKYRALFESMDEAYAVVEVMRDDASGRWVDFLFLEVNPAFVRHTGMEYPVGRTATQLLGTPNPRWAELYGRAAETGEPIRLEEPELTLGHVYDLYIFRLGGPGSRRVAILFTNITERKRAEAALRESEARFRALVTATSYAVYRMSPDWSEMHQLDGRGFLRDTGRPCAAWPDAYIHPDDQAGVLAAIAEAIRAREVFELEHRVRRADGSLGWTLSRAVPLLDDRGEVAEWFGAASDVTARREAEAALGESEGRLRLALAAARMGIWTLDLDGGTHRRDANLNRQLGLEPVETAQPFDEFLIHIHPDDRQAVREAFAASAGEGKPLNVEFRVVRPDGSVRWLRDQGDIFGDSAAGSRRMAGACADVTERAEAEGRLRASEERLRAVAANLPNAAVLVVDPGLRYTLAEGHALRAAGFVPSDLEGKAVAEAMGPDMAVEHELNYRRALAGEDFSIEHASHGRHYATHLAPLRDPAGSAVAALAVSYDITDRVRAEEGVRQSEERLRQILASATDYAILTQAPDRTVTSWSPGAAAAFGYSAAEIVGLPGDVLFTPEDRAAGAPEDEARTARREGRAADERWHMRKDGSRFYASGVLNRLGDGGPHGFVKVLRDLTDRKHMEDELRRARDELELRVAERTADLHGEIERRKDLTRRLAKAQEDERRRVSRDLHDSVGQLLAGLSMAFKAVETAGALPPPVAGKLAEAQAIVDSLGKEAHGLAVRLRPTSLDDIGLEPALGQLVAEWSGRVGVRADFNSSGLGPGRLTPEIETTLYRVVQEALTNIAKHARASVVSVVVSRPDGYVTAVIEDDGTGFDAAAAPKGRLGLVGMNERVALVGGELEVESESGSGTTVYVRIPTPAGEGGGP